MTLDLGLDLSNPGIILILAGRPTTLCISRQTGKWCWQSTILPIISNIFPYLNVTLTFKRLSHGTMCCSNASFPIVCLSLVEVPLRVWVVREKKSVYTTVTDIRILGSACPPVHAPLQRSAGLCQSVVDVLSRWRRWTLWTGTQPIWKASSAEKMAAAQVDECVSARPGWVCACVPGTSGRCEMGWCWQYWTQ